MNSIEPISEITLEHGLGSTDYTGFIKLRVVSEKGNVMITQMDAESARQILADLALSIGRADYETDLWASLKKAGLEEQYAATVLEDVRMAEYERHTGNPG